MSQTTDWAMVWSVAGAVLQVLVIVAGAPVLVGLMRQVRARLEGRGAGSTFRPMGTRCYGRWGAPGRAMC